MTNERHVSPLIPGWINLVCRCAHDRHDPVVQAFNPNPAAWEDLGPTTESDRQWLMEHRIKSCEQASGCPDNCEIRRLANVSEEELISLLQSLTADSPKSLLSHF